MSIKYLYNIIFERFYQSLHRGWGGFDKEDTLFGGAFMASLYISLLESIIVYSFDFVISYIIYGEPKVNFIIENIIYLIMILNFIYFFRKKRYIAILEEVRKNRTIKQKRIHTLIAISFAILSIGGFYGIVYVMY